MAVCLALFLDAPCSCPAGLCLHPGLQRGRSAPGTRVAASSPGQNRCGFPPCPLEEDRVPQPHRQCVWEPSLRPREEERGMVAAGGKGGPPALPPELRGPMSSPLHHPVHLCVYPSRFGACVLWGVPVWISNSPWVPECHYWACTCRGIPPPVHLCVGRISERVLMCISLGTRSQILLCGVWRVFLLWTSVWARVRVPLWLSLGLCALGGGQETTTVHLTVSSPVAEGDIW